MKRINDFCQPFVDGAVNFIRAKTKCEKPSAKQALSGVIPPVQTLAALKH